MGWKGCRFNQSLIQQYCKDRDGGSRRWEVSTLGVGVRKSYIFVFHCTIKCLQFSSEKQGRPSKSRNHRISHICREHLAL